MNRMEYLVIYHLDGETYAEMADTYEIGQLYGFSDCTDVRDIRVFRIAEEGAPIEVEIEPIFRDTAIALLDRETGEVLDECRWEEH